MFYNNRNSPEHSQASKNRKIQEIYKDELNNECFDCGNENPDFISANNGIFICKKCMGIHYQFTDDVSLIIKNNLFLLNEEQINYIYFGGNRKLLQFVTYEFPQLQNLQPEIMYKTQAMQYYRDNLYYLVEGGEKPIPPNDSFAYKLVSDMINYPLTEKREKNDYLEEVDGNNYEDNYENNYNALEEEDETYHLDDENINNININMNNSSNNLENKNNENYNQINDNIMIPLYKKNNSFAYNNSGSTKIPESESVNIFSNSNSKDNFYQKKDKFFNEMNRLFGGYNNNDLSEEQNTNRNIDIKTYKVKRPKYNYNYNNYIKNTININIIIQIFFLKKMILIKINIPEVK